MPGSPANLCALLWQLVAGPVRGRASVRPLRETVYPLNERERERERERGGREEGGRREGMCPVCLSEAGEREQRRRRRERLRRRRGWRGLKEEEEEGAQLWSLSSVCHLNISET